MQYAVFAVLISAIYGLDLPLIGNIDLPFIKNNWNGLYATWNAIPLMGFNSLPRQLSENSQFTLLDDQCASNGPFRGQRYVVNNDRTIVLLFDKNGIIAGMQTSSAKSQFTPSPGMMGFVDDGDYWTQTAYFVDPSTICTTGRTSDDLKNVGTGTGLWLQNGPDVIADSLNIPLAESDIKKTIWGSGKCFPSMGMHYWYNVTSDMSCNNFYPLCLLYNGGKLSAFCFAKNAYLQSPQYDWPHPDPFSTGGFMNPVPKCFNTDPTFKKLSTVHVYFHSNPRFTTLC